MTYTHITVIMHNSMIGLIRELQTKVEQGPAMCFQKIHLDESVECVGLGLDRAKETAVVCQCDDCLSLETVRR